MIHLIILFLLLSCITDNILINQTAVVICGYFLVKWISNYRKCTLSYYECKLRGIPKEEGYIYNILEPIFDYNKSEYRFFIYLFFLIILAYNFNKVHKNKKPPTRLIILVKSIKKLLEKQNNI